MAFSYIRRASSNMLNWSIKVTTAGQVIALVPKLTPDFLVEQFINSKRDWIEEALKKIATYPAQSRMTANSVPEAVIVFGKVYPLAINHNQTRSSCAIKDAKLQIALPTKAKVLPIIERFLKNTAKKYITPRTFQFAQLMDVNFKRISFKQQSSRWGSCSSQGNLNFNWRLIHSEPAIIDYVIIHELAHRVHLNHSRHFWELVAKHDPEHRIHRGQLKRAGHKWYINNTK